MTMDNAMEPPKTYIDKEVYLNEKYPEVDEDVEVYLEEKYGDDF